MSLESIQIGESLLFLHLMVLLVDFFGCRPKTEALVRRLKGPVYCKKHDKRNAIGVYKEAYDEKRLERLERVM